MNKKILFTPVGGTDPISNFRDASILHICRIYKPDEVYMFLSKEMYENHIEDDRYQYCINRLGEKIEHTFHCFIIEDKELVNVQEYDYFYDRFRKEILLLREKMDETDILYVNTSSGSPAMKSALFILSAISEYKFIPLQVSTPLEKINPHLELMEKYDAKYYWENNEDNTDKFSNRCKEVKSIHLDRIMKLDLVKKHLMAFDYNAAVATAESIENFDNEKVFNMLKAANHRSQLRITEAKELNKAIGWDIMPIKNSEHIKIFEYAMVTWLKMKRGEYADFIRSLTPLILNLNILVLKKECKIDIEKLTIKDKKNSQMYYWDEKKMNKENPKILAELNKSFNGRFRFGVVSGIHVNHLIRAFTKDADLVKKLESIAEVEQEVRNIVAHTITSLSDEEIKQKVGITTEQIFDKIKFLFVRAGIVGQSECWDTYLDMNKLIMEEISL